MKNNKGFTLVEIIITIAISAILMSGALFGFNLLNYANEKGCAEKINSTLSMLRLETMSKGNKNLYMVLEWDTSELCYRMHLVSATVPLNEGNWSTAADSIKSSKIADKNITISYSDQADGSGMVDLNGTNPCVLISFYNSSGAFRSSWKQIKITSNAGTSIINMITKTGKHYIS